MEGAGRWREILCWGMIVAAVGAAWAGRQRGREKVERTFVEIERLSRRPLVWDEPLRPPTRTLVAAGGAVLVLVVAALAGRKRGWLRGAPEPAEPSGYGATYFGAFAFSVFAGGFVHATASIGYLYLHADLSALLFVSMAASLGAIVYAARVRASFRSALLDWGWRRGRGILVEVALGVLVALAIRPLGYLRMGFDFRVPEPASAIGVHWVLHIVVWAPVVEETLFRGMLWRHLRDRGSALFAVLVSATLFTAVHMPTGGWPGHLLHGLAFAGLREWRGSLIAPVVAHAVNNALVVL